MASENPQFSSLIDLFESVNIVEKGIEQVYDFLLQHQKCDDIKILEKELGLTTKRIYKITSVLKNLDLIQIYNRPMKIQLLDPVKSWEKLVQDKIDEIRREANEKIEYCYDSLEKMKLAYKLVENESDQTPVEFISLMGNFDLEASFFSLLSNSESFIANGIWYHVDYFKLIEEIKDSKENQKVLVSILNQIKNNRYKILVNNDYIKIIEGIYKKIENSDDYQLINKLFSEIEFNLDIRITDEEFSSFIVKDNEILIQPSFDPNDNLIGYFISRPQEIVNVFVNKFNDIFNKAKKLIDEKSKLYKILLSL